MSSGKAFQSGITLFVKKFSLGAQLMTVGLLMRCFEPRKFPAGPEAGTAVMSVFGLHRLTFILPFTMLKYCQYFKMNKIPAPSAPCSSDGMLRALSLSTYFR